MEPVETAIDLVHQRFPHAIAAFLGGTVLTSARTSMSDLDIVVVRPDGEPTYRETIGYRDWPVELFVSTPTTYQAIIAREIEARRSPMLHMVGQGTILVDVDGIAYHLQAGARALLGEGPPPASSEEIEDRRYGLSDLLDDLTGGTDPDELVFIATRAFTATAELTVVLGGGWLGTGKWLSRQMEAVDPPVRTVLVAAFRDAVTGDKAALVDVAEMVLNRAGGRLTEGYRRELRLTS